MLYSKQVVIREDNKEGYIQSAGYHKGKNGFIIKWNGDVEFNNITARGHIEADTGYFRGAVEMKMASLETLPATQLIGGLRAFVFGERTPQNTGYIFNKSSNIQNILYNTNGVFDITPVPNITLPVNMLCFGLASVQNSPTHVWHSGTLTGELGWNLNTGNPSVRFVNNNGVIVTNPLTIKLFWIA